MLVNETAELTADSASVSLTQVVCKSNKTSHQDLLSPPSAPTSKLAFLSLPAEIHLMIFAQLDAIDAVCLSLVSSRINSLFNAYHSLTGNLPRPIQLNTRRKGPNELEVAWWFYYPAHLNIECRHCLKRRCELWRHVRGWVLRGLGEREEVGVSDVVSEDDWEYCAVKKKFGRWDRIKKDSAEVEGVKTAIEPSKNEWRLTTCWRGCPGKPWICGRHFTREPAE